MATCPTPDKRKYLDQSSALARLNSQRARGRIGNKLLRESDVQTLGGYQCKCGFWHLGHHTPVDVYNKFVDKLTDAILRRNELLEKLEQAKDRLRRRWAQRLSVVIEEDKRLIARADEFAAIVKANDAELVANMTLAKQLSEPKPSQHEELCKQD